MFCNKCGNQLNENVAFCNKCGESINGGRAKVGVAAAKRPNKRIVLIVVVGLVVVLAALLCVRAVQEKKRQEIAAAEAAESERISAELTAIDDVIQSYARAMSDMNFDYAATFCVPGGNTAKNIMDTIPGGLSVSGGWGSFLSGLFDFNYIVDYSKSSISLSEEKATVPATISIPIVDLVESQTIYMRKIDGIWYIETFN